MSSRLACFVLIGLMAVATARADNPPASLSGEWELTTTIFGSVSGERLSLSVEQGKITGWVYQHRRVSVTGTVDGDRVRFELKDRDGSSNLYEGRLQNGSLSGTVTFSGEGWGATPPSPWRARRLILEHR